MVYTNLKNYFKKAEEEKFAIGAFNIDSMEIFKAVLLAATNKKSPVILEFSQGELGYFGLKNVVDMIINAREEHKIPIFLNLDHSKKKEDCFAAIDQPGFDMVHFDGSELEYTENVDCAKQVVSHAHSKGLLVEGEIDNIAGTSEVYTQDLDFESIKSTYTDPKKAAKFVEESGVDIFAGLFGNFHGTFPTEPGLDFGLLATLRQDLPKTYLALHGGSGISADEVKEAIKVGKIVKVNVNTELREAYRDAMAEKLEEEPRKYKVYDYSQDVVLTVAAVVENKIDVFGSADKI